MAKKTKHASLRSTTNTTVTIGNSNASVDPLVVSFPGGIPEGLTAATLDDSHAKKPQFIWKRLKEGKHKHGRALMGTDNACIYQSQSPKSALDDERKTKLCVGIYDKQTGKLILHQTAERGYVFAMNQSVKSYKDNSLSALPGHLTSLEQRRVLFESFGSQKKRKVLKSQETNIVNVDSVVGAGDLMMAAFGAQNMSESNRKAIEETQNGTKVDPIEAAHAEARRRFLPSFDPDAEEPHLVYDGRDIGGDHGWGQVSRVVDACMNQDSWLVALTSRGRWADSVQTALESIPPHSPHAKYQIKCAVLLNHMIKFYNECKRGFVQGSIEEASKKWFLPAEVVRRFFELFTVSMTNQAGIDGFATSKQNKDKCLVHIFLLYLMAHGRTMSVGNIRAVADDVRIEISDAGNLLRAAGCTVTKKSGSSIMSAALAVPLTFPNPKRGGRGP